MREVRCARTASASLHRSIARAPTRCSFAHARFPFPRPSVRLSPPLARSGRAGRVIRRKSHLTLKIQPGEQRPLTQATSKSRHVRKAPMGPPRRAKNNRPELRYRAEA